MIWYEVIITCPTAYRDLLIFGFNSLSGASFWERDEGFSVYFSESDFKQKKVVQLIETYQNLDSDISYSIHAIPETNWNMEWEKNYPPVVINDRYLIRAPFHTEEGFEDMTNVTINSQMAFGTGHHITTELMITFQDTLDHKDKKVLDYGTGTGILAIIAEKKGAREVIAIDNDLYAIKSATMNIKLNSNHHIKLLQSRLEEVADTGFHLIYANINRNILIESATIISHKLKQKGHLVLSGFMKDDVKLIKDAFQGAGLKQVDKKIKDKWAACLLIKE